MSLQLKIENTPLYNALIKHKKLNATSFHTPGHKNSEMFAKKFFSELDFTELPDTDSLYDSQGVIKQAEELMSKVYGTKCTIFSAGGCTLCIQTMLKLVLPFGGKIVASRMIHKSAVNTMALLNAKVEWVMPQFDNKTKCFLQVTAEDVEIILQKNSDVKCVYITSPDYFGNIADIEEIAKICHKRKVPLLVDNAHGAHLKFLPKDIHPISLGADIVADSAHKTLPVLTGGALLHIADEKYAKIAKQTMSIFGSTSPSYPIMASLDVCCAWLKKEGKKAYLKLEKDILKIKMVAKQKGILDCNDNVDPIRLVFNTAKIGLPGEVAAQIFRENGVEPELSDNKRVVFIATPMNSLSDLKKLTQVMEKLPANSIIPEETQDFEVPVTKKSMHEAIFSESERVKSDESLGKISAATVCACPPGIPILVPGEKITEKSIKNLLYYGISLIDVIK